MKVISWNLNSIKARQERLLELLERHTPDVVCLQELKVTEENFPHDLMAERGYECAVYGQKAYNGVAILSRHPLTQVVRGLQDDAGDPQARLVAATVCGVRVLSAYVPNGSAIGTDKYVYKRAWLRRLSAYFARQHRPDEPLIICGDFNVAPREADVAEPTRWQDTVLCHPDMRGDLSSFTGWGLIDVFAQQHPEGGHYSWWDYRMLGFAKNNGLRIDHIYATESMAKYCSASCIDRDERKGLRPSDHAPVIAKFSLQ